MKQDLVLTRRIALILMLMFTLTFVSPIFISATSLDELQQQSQQTQEVPGSTVTETIIYEENVVEEQAGSTGALADYMRGYTPITEENMQFAATTMSPFVNLMGNLAGCIMVFATSAIFVVTALDLCYIAIPTLRPFLNPQLNAASGAMGGMPMGGGYGSRGYGGMMGGMSGGQPQQMPEHGLRRKWISDEAESVVNQYAQPQQQQPGMGGMSGMGMGMGMGMGYGGMGGMQQQPQQPTPMKIVIFEYFKLRVLFLVIFALASTLLMSSLFTDCGLNIAELGVKLMNKLNGKITEINI